MTEEKLKGTIKHILNNFGFQVEDIPTAQVPTPDLRIYKDQVYLVEVKIKGDDPVEIEVFRQELSSGQIVSRVGDIDHWNTLDGIIGRAVEQFESFDSDGHHLHIVWFHASGTIDPSLQLQRLHSTVYGSETLISPEPSHKHTFTCYYFMNSSFFRYRHVIDGVITSRGTTEELKEVQLCINSLSPRADRLRKSELRNVLGSGICDPDALAEKDQTVFIADTDIDRRNQDAMTQYLQEKYGYERLIIFSLRQYSGTRLLPKNDIKPK